MTQRVGRGIALFFHDHVTRRGWMVISTPRPYFTPGKDPVPIVQGAGWARGPIWTGGKSRPTGIRSPNGPARSQSLYRLSNRAYSRHCINKERIGLVQYLCLMINCDYWSSKINVVKIPICPALNLRRAQISFTVVLLRNDKGWYHSKWLIVNSSNRSVKL